MRKNIAKYKHIYNYQIIAQLLHLIFNMKIFISELNTRTRVLCDLISALSFAYSLYLHSAYGRWPRGLLQFNILHSVITYINYLYFYREERQRLQSLPKSANFIIESSQNLNLFIMLDVSTSSKTCKFRK